MKAKVKAVPKKRVTKRPKSEFTSGRHAQPDGIVFRGRSFRSEEGTLTGLTTGHLRNKYYPGFDLKKANDGDEIDPQYSFETDEEVKSAKTGSTKQRMARGRKVDTQVGEAIQWITKYELPIWMFCSGAVNPVVHPDIKTRFSTWRKSIHPKLIFSLLRKMQLTPTATQVIAGDLDEEKSTAVDLVCKNAEGENVLIELKAINMKTMFKTCRQMRGLAMNDCILNQSFVQLQATRALYSKTYPLERLSPISYTFVVNNKSCHAYKIPSVLANKRIY